MFIAIEPAGLSETQRQIVELAREFARTKIEPFAAEWDRTGHFARDVIDELGRLGFLGMSAPEEFDGMGLDSVTYLLALEEIAAAGEVRPPVPFRRERLDLGAREFARQLDDLTLRFGKARQLNRGRH